MHSWFPTFRSFFTSAGAFRTWWPWYTTTAQRRSLLRLIAVATEEHLPLAPLIESWMQDECGVQRRRVRKLARLLQQGRPLADAVELVPGVLREEDLLAIRFDAQSGTRTAAMRELLAASQEASHAAAPRLRQSLLYFCVLLPVSLLLIAFTQIRIVPVLGQIFSEFGMDLPPALSWSVASGGATFLYWWIGALALLAVIWWLLATRSGRPVRYALFGRLLRPWYEVRAAGVLQNIAIAVAAGRPIPGALSTLARYHFDPTIQRELLFVRNEVEQGADVWHSLAGVGMLSQPEVELLSGAQRTGNLAWILKTLVAAKERRTSQRYQWAAELVVPALVFLMAALVVFQAFTVFQPLTRIIESLS
jgi:type II secretory pathway component PulF